MYDIEELKKQILERLHDLDLKQVIIFGSHGYGTPSEESDIDLYVVTKDQFLPQSYKEKRELVRKISRRLIDLRQRVSIDLLVHTEVMNTKFYALNSSFAKEIQEKGLTLL